MTRIGQMNAEAFLRELFTTTVAAADPNNVLEPHLPANRSRPAWVIGAGKAAGSMASALEQAWQGPLRGLVVTRYGHGCPCEHIEVVEAGHPVPDEIGAKTAQRILDLVSGLSADERVIFLVSGGGSSLLTLPAPTIQMADKQQINRALLRSGAAIDEINCVRKHLSAVKGGRLALACEPATTLTLAISDVPGDDPAVIASGPTVADNSTSAEAIAILQRYDIILPTAVEAWLRDPASESIKAGYLDPQRHQYQLIATPASCLAAAQCLAEENGVDVIYLGDDLEGESRELAASQAALARSRLGRDKPSLILSGGETTVTLRGNGRGGRNTEFLLSLANELQGEAGIYALAADTDGIDGSEDNAGAILRPDSWQRARALGLDALDMLNNNDSYGYFAALDDLLMTGPTRTNVNDFRAIYISG